MIEYDQPLEQWLLQAAQLMSCGSYDLAIDRLKRILGTDPEHAEAHAMLSLVLLESKRLHAALYEARLAVGHAPESASAHHALGRALLAHQKLKGAREELHIAQSLDPEDVDVELALAMAAEYVGNRSEELEHLERALSLAPESAVVLARLAEAWRGRGDLEKAQEYARAALQLDPQHTEALVVMGFVLLKQGRSDEAREHALWALSNNATDVSALRLLVAIKTRENPLLGLWWRLNGWLTQAGNRRAIALLLLAFVLKELVGIYSRQHHLEMTDSLVGYAWIGICVYTWVGPAWFMRKIRQETRTVELSNDY